MKTVLYLSYTGMTDPLGQSQVLTYLKGLSELGKYQFVLISFEKKAAYEKLGVEIHKYCEAADIKWFPLPFVSQPPLLSTFNNLKAMRKLAQQLQAKHGFSLVHCRSYLASFVGLFLKRRYNIPYLFDMRGFWADERIEGGLWKLSNPLYKRIFAYFKKSEKRFLQQANHVVSLTRSAKSEILSWQLSPAPAPISVIPCCADLDLFDPAKVSTNEIREARVALELPDEAIVLSYLGSLGTWYNLKGMMEFVKVYRENHPNAYFMLLTGEPESLVYDTAEVAGLDRAFIRVRKVQRQEVPLYLSLSKFSLFFYNTSYSRKATSPVKQGELMAMGIPIICNTGIGDTTEIVTQYKSGVVIENFTDEWYRKAIQIIETTEFDPNQIRESAKQVFSLVEGVNAYAEIYTRLTEKEDTSPSVVKELSGKNF